MKRLIVFTRSAPRCSWCARAKALLGLIDVPFEEIDIVEAENRRKFDHFTDGAQTVPQLVIVGDELVERVIGGFDQLRGMIERDELMPALGVEREQLELVFHEQGGSPIFPNR